MRIGISGLPWLWGQSLHDGIGNFAARLNVAAVLPRTLYAVLPWCRSLNNQRTIINLQHGLMLALFEAGNHQIAFMLQ
jgi:hypothetical protein